MDMKTFSELADAYGGNLDRWPEAIREQARTFAKFNEAAIARLAEAAELDALLEESSAVHVSDLLARRILKSAPMPAFDADWRRPAMAAAFALFVGLAGGFAGGLVTPATEEDDLVSLEYADAFDGLEEDWAAWEWSGS